MNVILFWSGKLQENDTIETWRNRTIDLSLFHEVTLASQVKFNNTVYLCTYQKFSDLVPIPEEVTVVDANEYYPLEDAYSALKRGHSIAHISDLVRLKMALEYDAVVMDIDNIVINEFPKDDCFTSTMFTKLTGGLVIKFGPKHPAFNIRDNSWDGKALSVFPIKVHSSISSDITDLIEKIRDSLSKEPKKDTKGWNYVMWTLKDIANRHENVRVMKPIEFCPIPAWKSAGNCYSLESPSKFDGQSQLFGNTLPSIKEIFEKTYAVQHFFESAFKNADSLENNFWNTIKRGSLLDYEIKHIWGENWRDKKCINTTESLEEW
jgi:hypothetical protein